MGKRNRAISFFKVLIDFSRYMAVGSVTYVMPPGARGSSPRDGEAQDGGAGEIESSQRLRLTEPFAKGVHVMKAPRAGEEWDDGEILDDEGRVVEGERRVRLLMKRRARRRERVEGLVVIS